MKYSFLILSLLLFVSPFFSQLTFFGHLLDENNKKMKEVIINLFQENKLITTKIWDKKFAYDLKLNKYYTIELTKKGYVSKRIAISTFNSNENVEPFMFVMELVKDKGQHENDGFDTDFPCALIKYKKNKRKFIFDTQYAKNIKKQH